MAYKVTVLSVSGPIRTATGGADRYAPWSNQGANSAIVFQDPKLSEILIEDDDLLFHSFRHQQDSQIVADTVRVGHDGSVVIEAGTDLTSFIGTIIRDEDGNQYYGLFPRHNDGSSIGTELGNKTAVLIFPYSGGDTPHQVPFDPRKDYFFVKVESTTALLSIPYGPQGAPCFTTGTLIETQFGPRRIEALKPGDMIRSRDNGMRWLHWIGASRLDRRRLDLQPNLRPIRIHAGALGEGMPRQDLTVSPQHRVLIRSKVALRMFGETELLVAAKHLIGLPGIEVIAPPEGVTYWHMLFDGHDVVSSNGAWTESLFTGPQAMQTVGAAAKREIFAIFPELASPLYQPCGARRFLTGREGRKLVQRHARNALDLMREKI